MARSYRSGFLQDELDFALEEIREFRGPDEENTLRAAFKVFAEHHAKEPWAGAMVDNYRREVLALGIEV